MHASFIEHFYLMFMLLFSRSLRDNVIKTHTATISIVAVCVFYTIFSRMSLSATSAINSLFVGFSEPR